MNQTDVKSSLLNDARAAWRKGDTSLAEQGMFRALATAEVEKTLPDSLVDAIHELAGSYCVNRRYNDAARLYQRVLTAREKVLGDSHPDLVDSLDRLAVVLRASNAKTDAIAACYRAMSIRTRMAV